MKAVTVFRLIVILVAYQCFVVHAQNIVESPLVQEVENKKALFYNRSPDDKIKVVVVRVPSDSGNGKSPEVKRTRRQTGSYWSSPYSYGQPPLNPTGPPPGAFSPGTPFIPFSSSQKRRHLKRKTKYRPKPPPPPRFRHVNKTPCPYKKLAEELAAEAEQQRHYHSHGPPPLPPLPPLPTPPPTTTTTTTTTTTPAPPTAPPPVYVQAPPQPQIIYQTVEPVPPQTSAIQYETVSQDVFQTPSSSTNDAMPLLLDQNSGVLYQQQHPQNPGLPVPHQQFLYKSDTPSGEIYGRSVSSPLLISQPPSQQGILQEQLQSFHRIPGLSGNQLFFDRQAHQPIPQLALATSSGYPHHQQQPHQQQLVLLDNSQINSQVAPQPQTIILPTGQIVQTQQHPQPQQSLVLLNPTHQDTSSALSFLQPASQARKSPLNYGQYDLGSYLSEPTTRLVGGGLTHLRRSKPLYIPPPSSEEDEDEEPMQPVIYRPRKKARRPPSRDKKRFVIIPKKELDQMKYKKGSHHRDEYFVNKKNLPPPPEVVHIPYHETQEEDDDEEYEDDHQEENFNGNSAAHFSQAAHQQQQSKESFDEAEPSAQATDNDSNSTENLTGSFAVGNGEEESGEK